MKIYKLILRYFIYNILPIDFMIEVKNKKPHPKIKFIYLFMILVLIFSQIKDIFKNIDFYLWLKDQNINYLKQISKELHS